MYFTTAPVADVRPQASLDLSRVAVVGTSGSGKSTLARSLASRLGQEHIELDALHWGPGWQAAEDRVFRSRVDQRVSAPRWVCDGNYAAVRDLVWSRATAVIWLDLPFALVFSQALKRSFRRAWTGEPLHGGTNRERMNVFDPEWIPWWVVRTWRRNRRLYRERLESPEHAHLDTIRLRSSAEVAAFLAGRLEASSC